MATQTTGKISFEKFVESISTTPSTNTRTQKKLPEIQDSQKRHLKDRLLEPDAETITSLASLLDSQLDISHGEVVLSLGSHNLESKPLLSILDSDDRTPLIETDSVHGEQQDDNTPVLTEQEIVKLEQTLQSIAEESNTCHASILWNPFRPDGRILTKEEIQANIHWPPAAQNEESVRSRWVGRSLKVLVRRIPDSAQDLMELRVAAIGNVDAGKSTLLGVLTKGRLDDGRGRARINLARHQHELQSGRTSSVGMEIMAWDSKGIEVLPDEYLTALREKGQNAGLSAPGLRKQQLSWEEICNRGAKIVSFIDLAGHEKYLKTTIFGLTGHAPQFCGLIIGANAGLIGMCKEHLSVALALSVPTFIVVTKIDLAPPNVLDQTLKQLAKILRSPGCRKQPVFVEDVGMACELAGTFAKEKAAPIFLVSNVTGQGLEPLKSFLNTIPHTATDGKYDVDQPLEFAISDCFSVPFVGAVASGVVLSGKVAIGQTVLLGPDSLGHFVQTSIKSIQRKRVNVTSAEAGQSVSFALKRIRRSNLRKGMVIIDKGEDPPKAVRRFEGQVLILYHNTTIAKGYCAMLHIGNVRQTVKIISMDHDFIRTGDRAMVTFEFVKGPEYIRVGQKCLFREGKTKGLGIVTQVLF